MKKIKQYKGFVIAEDTKGETGYKYLVFTKDEYILGDGLRYEEWQADNIEECIEFIDSY